MREKLARLKVLVNERHGYMSGIDRRYWLSEMEELINDLLEHDCQSELDRLELEETSDHSAWHCL